MLRSASKHSCNVRRCLLRKQCTPTEISGHQQRSSLSATTTATNATRKNGNGIISHQPLSSYQWMSSVSSLPPSQPSSSASSLAAAATGNATNSSSPTTPPKSSSNIILDHLGTIFLSVIGLIVASLVRSSYGTSNRNKIRDDIEIHSALDPLELEALRQANAHRMTPAIFRQLYQDVVTEILEQNSSSLTTEHQQQENEYNHDSFNYNEDALSCTYLEFADAVKRAMIRLPPEIVAAATGSDPNGTPSTMLPTIELGHLVDRAVVGALQQELKRQQQQQSANRTTTRLDTELARPLPFWFTALSLALDSDVPERIRILYDILSYHPSRPQRQSDNSTMEQSSTLQQDAHDNTTASSLATPNSDYDTTNATSTTPTSRQVSWAQVCDMVGYLQETCQLAPDTQVVITPDRQYPIQQYHRGNPLELTPLVQDPIDLPAFAEILRSRSVCAWGECYHKAKQGI